MAEADSDVKKVEKKASAKMISEVGQPGLVTLNSFVKAKSRTELNTPNKFYTFDQMKECSAVAEPLALTKAIEINSLASGSFVGTGSKLSKALADYGNYCIHNMDYLTWHQAVSNMCLHIEAGYSLNEIVTKRETKGKYKGDLVLRHLGPRSPKSVHAWVWDEYKRRITHVVQKPLKQAEFKLKGGTRGYLGHYIQVSNTAPSKHFNKYAVLPIEGLLHNIYDASMSDPEGNSPLVPAYNSYQELGVLSEYEIIGVARNFGGVPVARVPEQLLLDANNPDCPEYNDARRSLDEVQDDLANAHAGRQAFFLLPSTMIEGTNTPEWDLKLLGIEGGGDFDIGPIIDRKVIDIYRAFNCTHLTLGQNGTSTSYSRAEVGTNLHTYIINRDLKAMVDVINSMLGRLLDAQRFEYDKRDLPVFKPATPDQLSLDEVGKFIQRTLSVGGMTPAALKAVLEWANISTEGVDSIDFTSERESGAGESKGSSGAGATNQQNSSTNMENKQLKTETWVSSDLGDQVALLDESGKLMEIREKN